MTERSHGLQAWIERLSEAELPALAAVVSDLERMARQESTSVKQLAEVLLRDAALTSKVLRVGNSSYYNPSQETISTISRAIVLIGFENVRLISLSVTLIDGLLARVPREQLQELLARSFHAAVQARNIAGYVMSSRQEEVFIAALLHNVGELAIWGCGGAQADELADELEVPGADRELIAQRILGTTFRQLTQGLVRSWNLGDVAALATATSQTSKDVAIHAVQLGVRISEAALLGWDAPEIEALVKETAQFTGVTEEDALQQILASADETVKVATTFGAGRLCRLIPQTDPEQIRLQQEQRRARLLKPNLDIMRQSLQALTQMLGGGTSVDMILTTALDGLHRGVGLERVMLAVLADGQSCFKARCVAGEATDEWRVTFRLPVAPGQSSDVFSYALRQRQSLWMGIPASYGLGDLVTDDIRRLLGKGMFFVSPVLAGSRPIGVLYADGRVSGRALKPEQFAAFQRFSNLTGRCLEALTRRS